MPLATYRLRRWLIVIAVLFITVIAGMYLYARLRQLSALKAFPGKIGIDIKQTASGFQFSKSEAGRTVFSIRAKSVKEFKLNGHAELHDVSIILYGRDTSRFDQIYGDDFTYDSKSGDVTARGDVQIDLQANPSGVTSPDQATPKELKNPIHLKTSDLIFNQNSGNASTDARVDFSTPQATGWAMGVQYAAKSNTLTLTSQIHVTLSGAHPASLYATHGTITREPREIVLQNPRMARPGVTRPDSERSGSERANPERSGILQADEATFYLGPDNEVQRVLATGNVNVEADPEDPDQMRARADEAELLLTGKQNLLRTATLTGNVHAERAGSQPMQGDAGRAILDFSGPNELQKVHASDGVRLAQHAATGFGGDASAKPASTTQVSATQVPATQASATQTAAPQDFDVTAPVVDFFVADGRRLERAETSGPAKITISPAEISSSSDQATSSQRTIITASRFDAKFVPASDGKSRLTSIHGAPNAKIVNVSPGVPDRVSTSQTLDAAFLAEGGIGSIIQRGNVAYSDGLPPDKRTQAWAETAHYTPADHVLLLTGSPRVSDGGMVTTAKTIRINRITDDAFAEGDVKTTYSELKEQPNGALLASASPIHVTAAAMTAHNSPAVALYRGNARLWQDANLIEAPSIQFDREQRSVLAEGTLAQLVSTVLVQKQDEKKALGRPIAITAARLTYSDPERRAHYDGGVTARGAGFSASSSEMDAYLLPQSQSSSGQLLAGYIVSPGQLDRIVAQGNVLIVQLGRRAEGHTLIYTAADDRFVLTGGPPSIFDAERGKITGVSLTFFRRDDRVLVEGEARTPVITQTRVAR